MKKWLIIAGIAVLVILLLAGSAWLWLTRSESGARWALARAATTVEQLEYDALSGGLASGITLEGLRFAQAGTRVNAESIELAARIELFAGPRVVVRHLRGRGIDVHLPREDAPDEPAAEPFDLSALASPVEVIVEQVELQQITVHGGEEPLEIERVTLAGSYGDRLELERFEIVADPGRATAQGEWALEQRGSGRLSVDAAIRLDDDSEQTVRLVLEGRVDALDFELTSSGPSANVEGRGRLRGLPGSPSVEAEITGGLAGWPGLPLSIEDLVLKLDGQPNDWRAQSSARVTGADIPPGEWSMALSGSMQALTIETLEADILGGQITGSGQLDWGESAPASQARLQFEDLDLTPLYPEWPNQGRISGELAASTREGVIELESLALRADPGDLSVSGQGVIDPANDRIDVSLEWRQFAWPPVTDDAEPIVASDSGSLRLEGRISEWQLQLDALLQTPNAPDSRVQGRISGDASQASIEELSITSEGGSMRIDGQVGWAPSPRGELALAFNGFDPAIFRADLPGRLDGRARIAFERDQLWRARVNLESLAGQLRGQSVSGSGNFAVSGQTAQSADLDLTVGDNRLSLSGAAEAPWQFTLDAGALDQLWPELAGRARLSGQVEPSEGRTAFEGEFENLSWQEYRLAEAGIEAELSWMESPTVALHFLASDIDVRPWERLEQFELSLDGDCDQHELVLTAAGSRGSIDLAGSGALPGCLEQPDDWEGQLERLYLGETIAGDWRLDEPLPIALVAGTTRIGAGCLVTAAAGNAALCLDQLSMNSTGRVGLRLVDVPMNLFLLPLDPVISLTSPLSGQIQAGWNETGLTQLEGRLELASGALRPLESERDLLAVDGIEVSFTPESNNGLRVDLAARLEGRTELTGQAQVANLQRLAESRIEADAQLDLPDIGAFGHLLTEIDRIEGRASGRIQIGGVLGQPTIEGQLSIVDGRVVHAPLGLDVGQVQLELAGDVDRARLTGSARSGEGRLELTANAQSVAEGWQIEGQLDGERFTFADAGWLQLKASPRVSLRADPRQLTIDGDVHIDRLQAGMPPGTAERIDPSPDVEVLGETEDEEDPLPAATRRISGRLGINLGDDARLAAAGLDTRLAGKLDLLWDKSVMPNGRGTIRLPQGNYQTYGQNLEISDGEVIFTGRPIDNPRLDIRAVRDIFGDAEVEAAGVHISGSARNPEIELYTNPPTSQEKALAYVVTGSDFDHAGGEGALNVGFYLLPKLFVSYGLGLFETGNVLSGRYELSRRWGVRVVSGERDTGVDLSYTVNN
jgi:translocation and assembly module TamB